VATDLSNQPLLPDYKGLSCATMIDRYGSSFKKQLDDYTGLELERSVLSSQHIIVSVFLIVGLDLLIEQQSQEQCDSLYLLLHLGKGSS
jgi:hypothetical protein